MDTGGLVRDAVRQLNARSLGSAAGDRALGTREPNARHGTAEQGQRPRRRSKDRAQGGGSQIPVSNVRSTPAGQEERLDWLLTLETV